MSAGVQDWVGLAVRLRALVLVLVALGLGSCARKGEPAPAREASPKPELGELDLWAGVPPLEPSAETLHDELTPKPGPARPDSVGESVELAFPPPALPSEPSGASRSVKGPLRVTRFGPEGEQGLVDAVRVSFNHPMVPLTSIERQAERTPALEIEPAVPGEFRWLGPRTLGFFPEQRLAYSTDYELRVAGETRSELGTELRKAKTWTISTPGLAIEQAAPRGEHVELEPYLVLRFNQRIEVAKLVEGLRLGRGSKAVELERTPQAEWAGLAERGAIPSWVVEGEGLEARTVVLRPSEALRPNTHYSLEVRAGVYGEGPRRSTRLVHGFDTYGPLTLELGGCEPSPCPADAGIALTASNVLADPDLATKVTLSPAVEGLSVESHGQTLRLRGAFVGETRYRIEVDASLADEHGQQLGRAWIKRVELGPLQPSLRLVSEAKNPALVEAGTAHTIELELRGLDQLELMGSSFSGAKLDDYLAHRNHGSSWRSEGWPDELREPRRRRSFDVGDSRQRPRIVTVELDDFIRGSDNFVYLLARSNVFERHGREARELLSEVVQVTNLGLSAALDRDDAIVQVTDLSSGQPLAGVELRLLDNQGKREIWRGKSDAAGHARPRYAGAMLDHALLFARLGEDQAFLMLAEGELGQRSTGHVFGREAEAEIRAMMFTERTPYKPGEAAHLVGILRRETKGPRGGVELWGAGRTASYTFRSPRGLEVGAGEVEISPFGTFTVELQTEARGDTGDYSFELRIDGGLFGRDRVFAHRVAVETFRTPEFEVELGRESSEPLVFGDELEIVVEGRYLVGAPMVGAELGYSLSRRPSAFRPPAPGLDGFAFGSTPEPRSAEWGWGRGAEPSVLVEAGTRRLDRRGRFVLGHALVANASASEGHDDDRRPGAATFTLEASVTDANRQAVASRESFIVHPAAYYVGLRSERKVLREGQSTRVEAVVVDVEGTRIEGVEVELTMVRKRTTRVPVQDGGTWRFDDATEVVEVSRCSLQSARSVAGCVLEVGPPGTHELQAEIRDAQGRRNMAAVELFVHGDAGVIWGQDRRRVDLVTDQARYAPGERAQILVRSPFEQARGFLVVEREGIAASHALEVEGGVAIVDVDITPEMVGGASLAAVLTKPRTELARVPADQDLGAPAVASGRVELAVSSASKAIVVGVEPQRSALAPGETLAIELDTRKADGKPIAASVALFVVDEGVLGLMGYQTPQPLDFFHRRRASEVGLFADHTMILPRSASERGPRPSEASDPTAELGSSAVSQTRGLSGELDGLEREGRITANLPGSPAPPPPGASEALLAAGRPVSLRTLFASTAHFEAEVRTDARGRARVEVEMPDNLTRFRIMAVAVDPEVHDRFGSGEASVQVRKPIMLRPSLPRFLNLGDVFEASLMVDNLSEDRQTIRVGTRGLNVSLPGPVEVTLEIPAGESREARFAMAVDQVGTMRLQFAALAEGGRDATELDIPVSIPAIERSVADHGVTTTGISRTLEPPTEVLPGSGGLELSLSSTALNGLEDAVEFLVDYPYECSEQTASRLLPIFALGDVLDQFPIAAVSELARRDALAREGIDRLIQRQNWDGGFGYWGEGGSESWPYVSAWVTLALVEGKRAGHEVDALVLDQALNYLETYVRNGVRTRWGSYYDWTTRALALWLLAREGRGLGSFAKVWSERERMPLYGRLLLASAAHRYGKKAPVAEVLAELDERVLESAKHIHLTESTSEVGAAEGLAVLMHSSTQTDAIALMTLIELGEELDEGGMAAKIMAGLMAERDPRAGGRWSSTHANAWALMAASRYFETLEAEVPDFVARIWLDAEYAGERAFVGRDMAKVNLAVPMATLLDSGFESLTVEQRGQGRLYYRLGLRYVPANFELEALARGFTVSRRYEALPEPGEDAADPEAVVQLADGSWRIQAGTTLRVQLTIVADDRASFVVVDDPLPAGFEGQNPRFETSLSPATATRADRGSRASWWHPGFRFDHTQMRDDRMLLFADRLPAGVYTYSYSARATTPGTFVLAPVRAEAMYEPERFGHGAATRVEIVRAP